MKGGDYTRPVGQHPEDFGVTLLPLPDSPFAKNDVGFIDPTGVDHDRLGGALKKAIYNFMHGGGLEEDVRVWFEGERAQAERRAHAHR